MQNGSDAYYKGRVVELAKAAEMQTIAAEIEKLFCRMYAPSPEATFEAIASLGDSLEPTLRKSVRVVEGIEYFTPGFKKWLGKSGWGNSLDLIKLFSDWQVEAERKKWLHKSKPN